MKRFYAVIIASFVLLSAVVMNSCSGGGRTLTSATGTIYECLVVLNDEPLTQEQRNQLAQQTLYDNGSAYDEDINSLSALVRSVMEANMPALPQMEPYFTTSIVPHAAFDDLLKPTRNILIIDINPERYTTAKAKIRNDYWSTPQAVYTVQTPDADAFIAWWKTNGENVRKWFVDREIERQGRFLRGYTNLEARAKLQQRFYSDMYIPEDYMLLMDTAVVLDGRKVNFLWCCNNKGPMRRDLLVYGYDYTEADAFTPDKLNRMRDEVVAHFVSGSVEGSKMGTEYKVIPPVYSEITLSSPSDKDHPAIHVWAAEVRGLWKLIDGEAMGGPYVSLTRLDEINQQVITAETFLYASGQKKRNALRQAEAILYTLRLPQDLMLVDN